ncbi:molybdate transport system substrate-binding protein [Paraburkholderia sp. GAS333]|uniref:substrate-binding domain-containing protein n=1 Tax=Paraburkholderia sp. GAS333 TaxID=3156279 RepID=UPI003D1B563E
MVSGQAGRKPITGISSMATRQVLAELAAAYERKSGQRVIIESVGGVDAARRVQDGEAFDIVVLASDALDRLAATGHVDPSSKVGLARSGVAIAVAAGERHPDISTEAALREAVLNVRSIGYSTGPSGTHLTRLFERWGIAESIASRIVQAPAGVPVGALVARGDVALGFQQLSELIHLPGIEVVGAMPPSTQVTTIFAASICPATKQRGAAQEFLSFLTSREADDAKLANGMEPV